ncbi:hypothetical protein Srufu_008690 [Streptomyces libani subsp. rufus]|nr:hypothetical protein Srufu_008690 [Streptomyces libani subsp. rufus]
MIFRQASRSTAPWDCVVDPTLAAQRVAPRILIHPNQVFEQRVIAQLAFDVTYGWVPVRVRKPGYGGGAGIPETKVTSRRTGMPRTSPPVTRNSASRSGLGNGLLFNPAHLHAVEAYPGDGGLRSRSPSA